MWSLPVATEAKKQECPPKGLHMAIFRKPSAIFISLHRILPHTLFTPGEMLLARCQLINEGTFLGILITGYEVSPS